PLYEAIILKAREMHLAGATALRGPIGFGKSSRMHTSKILRLSMDLPIIIEIIDSEEKIQSFLPVLDGMITGGLVTMEKVRALHYRAATPEEKSRDRHRMPFDKFGRQCAISARANSIRVIFQNRF